MSPATSTLLLAALAVAAGLTLIVGALSGRQPDPARTGPTRLERWQADLSDPLVLKRVGITAAAALAAGLFTGWPVAALLTGGGVWFLPELLGRDTTTTAEIARIEAIATWAEMMRDTLSAAAGLEQAILATAPAAPGPIRTEVSALSRHLRAGARLEEALKDFADELADPTGDLIIAALILASRQQARNLADVMGSLAEAARAQAALRMRTAADRARIRTSVRVIISTVLVMAVGLVMLNRSYLNPYDTPTGQMVLLVVAGLFGAALMWLSKIAKGTPITRFLTRLDAAAPDERRRQR